MSAAVDQVAGLLDDGLDEIAVAARTGLPVSRVRSIADRLAEHPDARPTPADQAAGGLEWAAPPPRRGPAVGVARVAAIIAELRAHPGQWAVLRDQSSGSGSTWKRRGCEVVGRAVPGSKTHRVDLYVRWPAGGDQ